MDKEFTREDYFNALQEVRSAMNSMMYSPPELVFEHLVRIKNALEKVGITPDG